jgi:hypothetical protein
MRKDKSKIDYHIRMQKKSAQLQGPVLNLFDGLYPQQAEAVREIDRPLLAGAGSRKP